jgi:hypothetical protein
MNMNLNLIWFLFSGHFKIAKISPNIVKEMEKIVYYILSMCGCILIKFSSAFHFLISASKTLQLFKFAYQICAAVCRLCRLRGTLDYLITSFIHSFFLFHNAQQELKIASLCTLHCIVVYMTLHSFASKIR